MKILVNGIELFYEISGQGRPLILVHGNGEDHHIFDALVAKLKITILVIVLTVAGMV